LLNTYWWINIHRNFSADHIDIVVHPYIGINNNKSIENGNIGFKSPEYTLEDIVQKNQIKIMQLFISMWYNFDGKDKTKVDISCLRKIEAFVKKDLNIQKMELCNNTLGTLLDVLNWSNLTNALNGKIGKKIINQAEIDKIISHFL
jgi:hypothetical protein